VIHRVLVVEDHQLWRRYLSSALQRTPQWQIVGEASDGPEAVEKAQELNPDLILMDVGLPTMNGLQAARRILAENPGSRILFVSENRSWDVAEAAIATGARGYVVKSDAGRELLPAMDAVGGGGRFMSARLAGRIASESRRHEVVFYSGEPSLLEHYAGFAETALNAGNGLILLVDDAKRDEVYLRMRARGVDVDRAVKDGRCISLDVAAALPTFMVEGWPDEGRVWSAATSLIMGAARASKAEHPRVVVLGEGCPGLFSAGRATAAIRLEQLWDDVARTYDVDVFCPYSTDNCDAGSHVFQGICAAHSGSHRSPSPEIANQ
jgi:DNA-binding NarL/FixJ family response regulator